eukprot:1173742-Rhodomonas_salina.5
MLSFPIPKSCWVERSALPRRQAGWRVRHLGFEHGQKTSWQHTVCKRCRFLHVTVRCPRWVDLLAYYREHRPRQKSGFDFDCNTAVPCQSERRRWSCAGDRA